MLFPVIGSIAAILGAFVCLPSGVEDGGYQTQFNVRELLGEYRRVWHTETLAHVLLIGMKALRRDRDSGISYRKEIIAIHIATLISFVVGLYMSRSALCGLLASLFFVFFLYLQGLKVLRTERHALVKQIPDVLRTMGMMLATGKTLMQACSYISESTTGKISDAFSSCSIAMQLGEDRACALNSLIKNLDIPYMKLIVCALEISQLTGAPLQDMLDKSAILLEGQQKAYESIRVKTTQAQTSIKVVIFLPIIIVSALLIMSSEYRNGLMTQAGIVSLVIAFCLDTAAIFIVKKLMRRVETNVIS